MVEAVAGQAVLDLIPVGPLHDFCCFSAGATDPFGFFGLALKLRFVGWRHGEERNLSGIWAEAEITVRGRPAGTPKKALIVID